MWSLGKLYRDLVSRPQQQQRRQRQQRDGPERRGGGGERERVEDGGSRGSVGNTVAMFAERERIEGIRQIEVAWSRVPGAESTGLHTEHTPSRGPSLTLFRHSLFLAYSSPSLSNHDPRRLFRTVASSSFSLSIFLSPCSFLGGEILAFSSSPIFSLAAFRSVRFLDATPSGVDPLAATTSVAYRRRRRRRRRRCRCRCRQRRRSTAIPSCLADSFSLSTTHLVPFLPHHRHPSVVDHPPSVDVSAFRIASESHPMENATSKSRRG